MDVLKQTMVFLPQKGALLTGMQGLNENCCRCHASEELASCDGCHKLTPERVSILESSVPVAKEWLDWSNVSDSSAEKAVRRLAKVSRPIAVLITRLRQHMWREATQQSRMYNIGHDAPVTKRCPSEVHPQRDNRVHACHRCGAT